MDTAGCECWELDTSDAQSKANPGEAVLVACHVRSLVNAGLPQEAIAVITPYNLQVWLSGVGVGVGVGVLLLSFHCYHHYFLQELDNTSSLYTSILSHPIPHPPPHPHILSFLSLILHHQALAHPPQHLISARLGGDGARAAGL